MKNLIENSKSKEKTQKEKEKVRKTGRQLKHS